MAIKVGSIVTLNIKGGVWKVVKDNHDNLGGVIISLDTGYEMSCLWSSMSVTSARSSKKVKIRVPYEDEIL